MPRYYTNVIIDGRLLFKIGIWLQPLFSYIHNTIFSHVTIIEPQSCAPIRTGSKAQVIFEILIKQNCI